MMALAALASTAAISCPATLQGRPLTTVQVFDGPPRERADLEPDERLWDLKAIRSTSSPEGFFLVCGYGSGRTVTLRLPRTVETCRRSGLLSSPRVACR
jgi:hypothetical protein